MKLGVPIACLFFLMTSMAGAETIFTWTDENQVKRFSDKPPPAGIVYSTIETPSAHSDGGNNADRSDYDRMIQELRRENRKSDLEHQRKAAAEEQRERQDAEADRREKIQARRQELQSRIDALNNRALSPTFTQGMRQAQIEDLQKEMEELEKRAGD